MQRQILSPMVAVGQIIKLSSRQGVKVSKVRVEKMSLDTKLLMYFPKKRDFWTADFKKETKLGDIVVIRNLERKIDPDVYCQVDHILYQVGAVIDPLTGRLCRGTEFVDIEKRKIEQSKRKTEDITELGTVEKRL